MASSVAQQKPAVGNPSFESPLLFATPVGWVDAVLADFDRFLLDHAAAEKKASGMAISMLSHYPDRVELVEAMADLAIEELSHYREVVKWIHQRGGRTGADTKDAYVGRFRKSIRDGKDDYLLDRLLTAGIIEARGAERFALIADALEDGPLHKFYRAIARSEERHFELFLGLAECYFAKDVVARRWQELLEDEADIVRSLPLRAALH
ncbi:tRNA-(ms[2]io[6]A)-hydroxylase [Congregibacter sp.]|uniref:tRNA-(ms[2]io[6]A)-hydroxylase n=1 Tax=Congregibacter sp. TaxID=2744308 RepID=UPI00385FB812